MSREALQWREMMENRCGKEGRGRVVVALGSVAAAASAADGRRSGVLVVF